MHLTPSLLLSLSLSPSCIIDFFVPPAVGPHPTHAAVPSQRCSSPTYHPHSCPWAPLMNRMQQPRQLHPVSTIHFTNILCVNMSLSLFVLLLPLPSLPSPSLPPFPPSLSPPPSPLFLQACLFSTPFLIYLNLYPNLNQYLLLQVQPQGDDSVQFKLTPDTTPFFSLWCRYY